MQAQKRKSPRQLQAEAEAKCAAWNAKHSIGTMINFEEVIGRGVTNSGKTKSEATLMCGEAVIWFENKSGCVSLDHCTAVA